ncbi:MAG: hypothetical protein QME52_06500 [Bacteroidota bacterium]|nr:hypothetical protein [Bacteroidota bacterium]
MRLPFKILTIWIGLLASYVISISIFPSEPVPLSGRLNQIIQLLLLIISLYILLKEPNKKNKFIFLNFTIYFSLSLFSFVYDFIGFSLLIGKYSRHLYGQYLSITYMLALSIAVIYLVIDLLFRDFKVRYKYLSTLTIASIAFGFYFHPFLENPLYLYSTMDIKQWKMLDTHISQLTTIPSSFELANNVTLQSYNNGNAIGDLYPEENLKRIEELTPYLDQKNDNYMVLLWKPLYKKIINIDILIIGFILLFFGYQYKKDPPQGAYIDKIMFLILILQSMDILHNWGYIKSVEWGSLAELFAIGQYITLITELALVLFFSLRLRFVTSVQGEFYETELATNPQQVSRWRDWIDNLVIAQFFNYKIFNGRLFQNSTEK